jgi:hypothetical protein
MNMPKPRLSRKGKLWVCEGVNCVTYGEKTAEEAFAVWTKIYEEAKRKYPKTIARLSSIKLGLTDK